MKSAFVLAVASFLACSLLASGATYRYAGSSTGLRVKIDDGAWTAVTFTGDAVNALEVAPNDCSVFIGGSFTAIDNVPAWSAAVAVGDEYTALNATLAGGAGEVRAISYRGSVSQFGGDFDTFNGQSAANVVFYNPCGSTSMVGSGVDGPVNDIAEMGGDSYIVGDFSAVNPNDQNSNGFAQYDGVDEVLRAVGTGSSPYPFNGPASGVDVLDGAVYAGGDFTRAGGAAGEDVDGLAVLMGSAWDAVVGWPTTPGSSIADIVAVQSHIVVVGSLAPTGASDCGVASYSSSDGFNYMSAADCTTAGLTNGAVVDVWRHPGSLNQVVLVPSNDADVVVINVDPADGSVSIDTAETAAWAGSGEATGLNAAVWVEDPGANTAACGCGTGNNPAPGSAVPSLLLVAASAALAALVTVAAF